MDIHSVEPFTNGLPDGVDSWADFYDLYEAVDSDKYVEFWNNLGKYGPFIPKMIAALAMASRKEIRDGSMGIVSYRRKLAGIDGEPLYTDISFDLPMQARATLTIMEFQTNGRETSIALRVTPNVKSLETTTCGATLCKGMLTKWQS